MPITEKNYPIQNIYFIKLWIIVFFLFLVALGLIFYGIAIGPNKIYCRSIWGWCPYLGSSMFIFAGVITILIILEIFRIISLKVNFHYTFDEKNMNLCKGLLGKQEINMFYEVVQNVSINQDPLDKIFGTASLKIQNTVGFAAKSAYDENRKKGMWRTNNDLASEKLIDRNTIMIPGLLKKDAEILRDFVLQKMKENPIKDSQSGL